MFNNLGKITNKSKKTNRKTTNMKSRNSKLKSVSSELLSYMISKENCGISLYTHIQTLLDMFIFQNPIQPLTYFEYYSENIKMLYQKSQPNPDLNFFNNIDINIYNKIIEIYKDTIFNVREYKTSSISYGYEAEAEYDDTQYDEEVDEISVQDLSKMNYMFNKAGCGITNDEAHLIRITMDQMSQLQKFKSIRYWGKIIGLKRNYYILECEWKNKELEYKLRLLNFVFNTNKNKIPHDYDNENENQEEVELEKYILSDEENEFFSKTTVSSQIHKDINDESDEFLFDSLKSEVCSFLPAERGDDDDDYLSHEIFGFGANKKSYFVTNQLNDSWIELPLLKPHHIIQSRNIKRYFTGNLESPVESYPLFQGLEKHYLRAQIARITAATQISPRDYFVLNYNSNLYKWRKLNTFQSKAMSHKWVHEYVANADYTPLSVYDLLEPSNWVHHTPLISEKGVTKAWNNIIESEGDLQQNSERIEYDCKVKINLEIGKGDGDHLDIFGDLSNDAYVGEMPPWKFELTNQFDHTITYTTIRSNLWPGAHAVARENLLDYTYHGWGLKWNAYSFTVQPLSGYQRSDSYRNDSSIITEIKDPTREDELMYFAIVNKRKEDRARMKIGVLQPFNAADEDEERILNQHDYDD
ncbi:radial spoke head protein 6 homolog A-like [Rhopalosiphum maidis]|uniref:radial spoke head protein 6 homolog A-like n=1 Tax=Rhopalosiphum maidis TaxID=43146 RepID=UPI000F0055FB|nr:radial spoke head protein 6 homolog A-like [Rhopalosiphum maidis]